MPIFVINTNVVKSDVPAALLSEATNELAKVMEKPAQVDKQLSIPRLRFNLKYVTGIYKRAPKSLSVLTHNYISTLARTF